MSTSLELTARQTHFVIREGTYTKKVTVNGDWHLTRIQLESELDQQLQLALAQNLRTIIVLSEEDLRATAKAIRARLGSGFGHRVGILVVAKDPATIFQSGHEPFEFLDAVQEKDFRRGIEFHLRRAVRILLRAEDKAHRRLNQRTLEKLNEIFIALSAERNPERLLATILLKALELGNAESGLLYMVNEKDGELYFQLKISNDAANNQVSISAQEVKVVENSICGYVALTGRQTNIKDVNSLRPMTLPALLKSVDFFVENSTKAMMTVPLKNSRNEVIAVLQLANKKPETDLVLDDSDRDNPVFEAEDESLLSSFATQAAICLENVDLYRDIQRLFEGFVRASISAIESRDPSTGGHSERVAKLSVALARATTEVDTGIYRSVKFKEEEIRELEYAALLHDFGKIGVREEVLVKAKKLYTWQLDAIKERIKICKAAAKIAHLERQLKSGADHVSEKDFLQKVQEIDGYWQMILAANEPAILKKESQITLERIRNEQLLLPDGSHIALLTEEEYLALSVTQGSLTENERLEIESHVRHTYQFLKMIPWTRDFKHLPEIAYCHHEKLDGTGYPRGLTSHEIPLQSKIMTIADIFDALTAADRWYKEAVPIERALDILGYEVQQGKLDPVLYEIFIQKKVYEATQPKIITRVA